LELIGFADDYIKVFRKNKDGLSGKIKILGQIVLGLVVGITMLISDDVVIRMPLSQAQQGNYEVVKTYSTLLPRVNDVSKMTEMAYVKSSLTNLPFWKNNNL
jgi:phospho-N-acetylmuramoyl-pentapeptide-transferase